METFSKRTEPGKNPTLSALALNTIRSTIPWIRFMSIIGFIGIGMMLITAFVSGASGTEAGMTLMVTYLIAGAVGFFPALFTLQYARNLSYYLASGHMQDLEIALHRQKRYYIYVGTIIVIYITLVLLGVVFSMGRYYP